jgi:hypothetical protein
MFSLDCLTVITPSTIVSISNLGISYFISISPSDLTIKGSLNAASTYPIIAPSDENILFQELLL